MCSVYADTEFLTDVLEKETESKERVGILERIRTTVVHKAEIKTDFKTDQRENQFTKKTDKNDIKDWRTRLQYPIEGYVYQ